MADEKSVSIAFKLKTVDYEALKRHILAKGMTNNSEYVREVVRKAHG